MVSGEHNLKWKSIPQLVMCATETNLKFYNILENNITSRFTAVFFYLLIFTKWRDLSIWRIDNGDWPRAVVGIQNSK